MNMNLKNKIEKAKEKYDVYFIAELGQNHQGDLNIAYKMIDSLKGIGVSAVKTAKRDVEIYKDKWLNQPYNNSNSFGKNYYEHRKALELSKDDFIKLKLYAEENGFDFISSFTDENSLDFLNEIGVSTLKIASSRITDMPLLEKTATTGKDIIMSSGMSTINDIKKALNVFNKNIVYLLQCTSCYPCKERDINLNVINNYKKLFKKEIQGVGFSGHHIGIAPDIAAYMIGVDIIERHYTLNRAWKGTDHAASLGKNGIEYIIKYINQIKKSMGSFDKEILECEYKSIKKLRI